MDGVELFRFSEHGEKWKGMPQIIDLHTFSRLTHMVQKFTLLNNSKTFRQKSRDK